MGRTEVTWRGESISLDVSPGTHTLPLEDHYALRYASERPHPNIWRIRYWGLGTPTDGARLGLRVFGNLGLDDDTIPTGGVLDIDSASLPYTWFVDDLDQTRKPSILTLVVPSQADEVINLSTQVMGDRVEITADELMLPVTVYITSSYLPREDLIEAIRGDLDFYDGAQNPPVTPVEATLQISN
jgi:hypothetical protein